MSTPMPAFNHEPKGRLELPATEIVLLATKCFKDMNDDHAKRYTELVDATGPEDEIPDEAVDIGEDLQAGGPMCHALDPRYTVNTTDYPGERHILSPWMNILLPCT